MNKFFCFCELFRLVVDNIILLYIIRYKNFYIKNSVKFTFSIKTITSFNVHNKFTS